MPAIPVYNQKNNLQISNPTGFQNAASAGAPDRELQNFGAVVSDTAVKLDHFYQASKATDRKLKVAGYRAKAAYDAYEVSEQVKGMDAKERPKAYYELMQQKVKESVDGIEDADVKAEAAGIYDSTFTSHFEKVAADSMNDHLIAADQKLEQNLNDMNGLLKIDSSPKNLQMQIDSATDMIAGSDIYDQVTKTKKIQEANYLMVDSAISSMVTGDSPNFDQAEKQAKDFIKYVPQEKQKALFKFIEDSEHQWKTRLDYDRRNPPLSDAELLLAQENKKPSVIRDRKYAESIIQAAYARDEYIDKGSEEDLELQSMAIETMKEADLLRMENPRLTPSMAAAKALEKYAPNVERLPRVDVGDNEIDQNTSEGISKANVIVRDRYLRKGVTTKSDTERYLLDLEILAARKSALRRASVIQEQIKQSSAKKGAQ